jgi:hypothetical protein
MPDRSVSLSSACSSTRPSRTMRNQGSSPPPEISPGLTVRSMTRPLTGAVMVRRLARVRNSARAASWALACVAAGLDGFLREHALAVEALDARGFGLGLGGDRRLLVDLGAQQGGVELDQRLAGADVGAFLDQHARDAVAGEFGADGGFLAGGSAGPRR